MHVVYANVKVMSGDLTFIDQNILVIMCSKFMYVFSV